MRHAQRFMTNDWIVAVKTGEDPDMAACRKDIGPLYGTLPKLCNMAKRRQTLLLLAKLAHPSSLGREHPHSAVTQQFYR